MNKELKIETKFSLGDTVYFVKGTEIRKDIIVVIKCILSLSGSQLISYYLKDRNESFSKHELFSSFKELTDYCEKKVSE